MEGGKHGRVAGGGKCGGLRTRSTGYTGKDSERLSLAPGWGGWVDSGESSEGDSGGKMGSLLYGVLSLGA